MSQPSVRAAVHRLSRASRGLITAGGAYSPSGSNTPKVWHSWEECGRHYTRSRSFPSQGKRNVLSTSTILSQDGLEIQELPVLVRLLDKNMVPFSNHSYTGEHIRPMTAEDENFQNLLQRCMSVTDVFKLLEIPLEKVTGYSASAALQRMAELQKMNKDWDDLPSFIRTAVMNELYDTVTKDVAQLSNDTLFSLVSCYVDMENFGPACASAVNAEIEKRMVEEKFEINELCGLSDTLQSSDRGDKELINTVWVFIGNHYKDVTEHNISLVLSSLPASHKSLLKVFGKQLHRVWWKMKGREIAACLSSVVQLNSLQMTMMTDCARWLFLSVHEVTDAQLATIVGAYIHFQVSDANLITSLERFVPARGSKVDITLLGLVQEYCRARRYFSPTILESAADHFCQNGDSYSSLQIFTILRPFGQLGYLPKDSGKFLFKVELLLNKHFASFSPQQISELLCSFAFVERIPLNFIQKVLTPSFLGKVKDAEKPRETGVWLELLQSAVMLETRGVRVPCLYKLEAGPTWRDDRIHMLQSRLGETLGLLLGDDDMAKLRVFAPNTIHSVDAELHVSTEGLPVKPGSGSTDTCRKVAILLLVPEHFCVNSRHLLGRFAMRRRHLKKLGYTVIEVLDSEFLPLSSTGRVNYLREKLQHVIDFPALK